MVSVSTTIRLISPAPYLSNSRTNWELFRSSIEEELNCNVPLRTEKELEAAVEGFTKLVQRASWKSTPEEGPRGTVQCCSAGAMAKIKQKRKIRKQW